MAADPNFPSGLSIKPSSRIAADELDWDQDNQQDIDDYGIAGRIWEAAYLLARYLRPVPLLEFDPVCSIFVSSEPIVAIELGSGAGYGGLHLAQQLALHTGNTQARRSNILVLTDLGNVVPLMQRNVQRAGLGPYSHNPIDVRVCPLSWGSHQEAATLTKELEKAITHLVCSDLVYFPELLPLLLRSLIDLSEPSQAAHSGPELIISYKIRSLVKEQPFWSALGHWFDYTAVDCRPHSKSADQSLNVRKWHRFGSLPSDYGGSEDDDQEYFLFVGRRRTESLGCKAPAKDSDLMQGKRLRRTVCGDAFEYRLETSATESDYFEWLLLSTMGAGMD